MLTCSFVSPSTEIIVPDVQMVVARATNGELGIMPGHVATVSHLLDNSTVRAMTPAGERIFHLGIGSFLRVAADTAVVLTSSFAESNAEASASW